MLARDAASERVVRSGTSSRIALGAMAMLFLTGVWVRFNDRIAATLPFLGAPGSASTVKPSGLIELALLPQGQALAAVAGMGLPTAEAAALTEALRRGRLRLIRMPVFDAQPDPSAARIVRVSAGGYATTVQLSAQPVPVTLPIGPVGTVQFAAARAGAVAVGALTLDGAVRFPDLPAGQMLEVGVIAQ